MENVNATHYQTFYLSVFSVYVLRLLWYHYVSCSIKFYPKMKHYWYFLVLRGFVLLALLLETIQIHCWESFASKNALNFSSQEGAFVVSLELFQWQRFAVITGEGRSLPKTKNFREYMDKISCFYEADVVHVDVAEMEHFSEGANAEPEQPSNYVMFVSPTEFVRLSASVPNFLGQSWAIVSNTSVTEWLKVLGNFELSLNSNFYLVNDSSPKYYQVVEIYRICNNCSMQVHNVCRISRKNGLREGSSCNSDKYQRRQNLGGFPVRAIGLNVNPFDVRAARVINNTWSITGGMWAEIFHILELEFNISTSVEILDGYKFGKFDPVTKTWTGILGAMSTGQADISLNPLSVATDRVRYIDYSLSVHSVGIRIYIRRSVEADRIQWKFFANPFSRNLIIAIILCCTFLAVFMQLVLNARPSKDVAFSFYNTCWTILAALCQKGSHMTPHSPSAKLIFLLAYLTFLIVFCAYSATLTSQLSVPQTMKLPFRNLKEMLNVKGWSGGPIRGDFSYNVMEKTCPDILAASANSSLNTQCVLLTRAWNDIVAPIEPSLPNNVAEGLDKALKEKFAFITTVTGARYALKTEMSEKDACLIYEINKDILSSNLALAFRKGFPLTKLFNYQLLKIYESGTLSRVRKRWWPMRKNCQFQRSDFIQAKLSDLAVAPLIVLSGMIISFLFLALERARDFYLLSAN